MNKVVDSTLFSQSVYFMKFTENAAPQLSVLKTITAVAVAAISLLTAMLVTYRYFTHHNNNDKSSGAGKTFTFNDKNLKDTSASKKFPLLNPILSDPNSNLSTGQSVHQPNLIITNPPHNDNLGKQFRGSTGTGAPSQPTPFNQPATFSQLAAFSQPTVKKPVVINPPQKFQKTEYDLLLEIEADIHEQIAMIISAGEDLKQDNELKKKLLKYADAFNAYVEKFHKGRLDLLSDRVVQFANTVNLFSDNQVFIERAMSEIDLCLTRAIFESNIYTSHVRNKKRSTNLNETSKRTLLYFSQVFSVVNNCLPKITDASLKERLKIKFANLPLPLGTLHSDYPHLYLSKQEHLNSLINHFQELEDKNINKLNIKRYSPTDVKRIIKLVNEKSPLSSKNLQTFREVIANMIGKNLSLVDWGNETTLEESLRQCNDFRANYSTDYKKLTKLYRASRAKNFFQEKEKILFGYHITLKFLDIIKEKKIIVAHQGTYPGAWISTKKEPTMSKNRNIPNATFVFTDDIIELSPDQISIHTENAITRWRGFQQPIPLKESTNSKTYLACIGLFADKQRDSQNQTTYKTKKLEIIKALEDQGIDDVVVWSENQMDYVQEEMYHKVGTPKLNYTWWGKGK